MPNVADELAALRAKGSVKTRRSTLVGGAALSTPEAEAAALKAKKDQDKAGNVKAKEIISKGSSAGGFDKETEHTLNQTGKKKAEWETKKETRKTLSKGGSGGVEAATSLATKKAEAPKKATAKAAPAAKATKSSEPAPTPAPVEKKEEPTATEAAAPAETDDVPDLEEADDDDVPELETPASQTQQQPDVGGGDAVDSDAERQITNRNEKKARKMMTRLGMRPVPNIARVTLKAGPGRGYFFIDRPDVFTATGGKNDTYVIFGEARQGGTGGFGGGGAQSAQAQAAMAQQQAAMAAAGKGAAGMPSVVEEEDDEDVPDLVADAGGADEEGVEAKDVELCMSQASCSRAKAVQALKDNDGDLVNAIMSLTT